MHVVVPEQGLVRLTERLLGNLGMNGVGVDTFDSWVVDQGQHILKGIPKRLCDMTPSPALTLKRHPAMYDVVDAYIKMLTTRIGQRIKFLFDELAPLSQEFVDDTQPLWPRVDAFEAKLAAIIAALPDEKSREWRKTTAVTFFKETRDQLLDVESARSEIFSSPDLLKVAVAHGQGIITQKGCEELMRHTRRQFVDPKSLEVEAVDLEDGKAVDGGELEKDEYAGTIDVEDYAVLLYLMLKIHGHVVRKSKSLTLYRHLVIDEAQDLAPIELKVLGQSLYDDATLTIAGDAAQQSDPNVVFRGWDDVMEQLETGVVAEARLQTNYRCPRPIAELGHKVLGPDAPSEMPKSIRDGADVVYSHFPNEGLAVVSLTDALTQLFERERQASVAVICETQETARRYFENLKNVDDVRLVIDGEFDFKPGVDVTDVSQVKGLEFDYVIIPDVNEHAYPDTPVARRSLHIAITRTVHQLWVISVGRPSPLIKA
jgi:DNA helicase-2/ATP-dependent DNA helicase PcrA